MMIRNNPVLFQDYLDFLSRLDAKTGNFHQQQVEIENQTLATKRLIENLGKKGQVNRGSTTNVQRATGTPRAANPHNELNF